MSVEYKDSGITLSLNDSVTPSDSLIKGISPVYADSITASDGIAKLLSKPLNDSASASVDLITTKHFDQLRTDSVTITDNIYKHPGLFFWDEYEYSDLITILVGSMPYVRPENAVFSEMRIKSVSGREPSNFYEVDEQGEEE